MEPTTENFDERKAAFLKELEDLQTKYQITLGAQQQVVFTASDRFVPPQPDNNLSDMLTLTYDGIKGNSLTRAAAVAAPEPSDGLQDGFKGVDLDA